MKLLTAEIKKTLPALMSQDGKGDRALVPLKFFTPDGSWTWYVLEGSKEGKDWRFFGKVVSNFCPEGELGEFMLSQLKKIRGGIGLPVERDIWWTPKPLKECT